MGRIQRFDWLTNGLACVDSIENAYGCNSIFLLSFNQWANTPKKQSGGVRFLLINTLL